MDVDKYLTICEQLGEEPDLSKMPLEISDFPEEVQEAFFVYSFLEDNWDGMSGHYMGKVWAGVDRYLDIFQVQEKRIVLTFMKIIEALFVNQRAKEAERKRKAEERRSKANTGGKNYTHNVRG
tara:strand:+ start:224 stop:592 length:369 start_codon:yes stop_codon:yes gene_type:complete